MPDHPFRRIRSKAAALAACALAVTVVAAGATPAYGATDTERPTTPGPITVVAVDTTWVELTWAASTDDVGVVHYPVGVRFEDFGAQYSTDTTSIRITGLRPSRTYTFFVAAVDAAGNRSLSDPSLRLTMPPGDDQPPGAPGQPVAYDVASTVVWVRWAHSVENVALERYEVFRVDVGGARTRVSEIYQYPPGRNSTQISGLTPNTTYTFVVQARDEAGHLSPLSEPVTVTTLPPPPSCAVRSTVGQWPDGLVARLLVTNTGSTAIDGWTMRWRFYAAQHLRSLWGAEVVERDSSYLRVRNVRHNALIPPGGTVSLGFVATGSQTPQEVTLNGGVCVVAAE